MVTSNKLPDKKVVKMAEHNNGTVVPQRTLLGEVNEHITCPLCRGYYIDATTIVECLHSFCRSCIIKHLQVKSYCPVCEMMINSAKPNIKPDKALQDIVYKLVPGLFQKEMERRQQFYASRPGPAATATPEQRGEDTERIIFSPEDVISFSLEYADATDADSISSKSSDSNEPQSATATTRRYLQCPAVVNISHLKKFLSMKFDIDSSQFAIDILYKRVPLPDYYTLMDIAYIYNWKRNEPMRFFYQIIDYIAIRNRLFDINRKGSHFRDRKPSPASTEDTNVSSPAPNLNDQASEASSGTDSPMPDDNNVKTDTLKQSNKSEESGKDILDKNCSMSPKKSDEDVEKSQFLNSFELTAKSNCMPLKSSPIKTNTSEESTSSESVSKPHNNLPKTEDKVTDTLKRKHQTPLNTPEFKKLKIEIDKAKIPGGVSNTVSSAITGTMSSFNQSSKAVDNSIKSKEVEGTMKTSQELSVTNCTNNLSATSSLSSKESKQQQASTAKPKVLDSHGAKRTVTAAQNLVTPKRKPENLTSTLQPLSTGQKTLSPLKLQVPKLDTQKAIVKSDVQKPSVKKMPDLKPSVSTFQSSQNKGQQNTKVRMDLLANNSDPTIDRSKILSQVKSSLSGQNAGQTSGYPFKSLLDSCNINIPSSLSITLTDQKLETRNSGDSITTEPKKNLFNKNLAGASNSVTHKVPSPPVHNYIEILKLPDTDSKKQNKTEGSTDSKPNPQNKLDTSSTLAKIPNKTSETSAKGPVPNLKPISDTKLAKQQSGNYSSPITFQQTFEQQLQSLQCDKKSKLPKNKAQVPKLVPATPKSFNAATKPNSSINKSNPTTENKVSAALDLSTPHNIQAPLGPQQTFDKAFETMQSIANLAKKQNLPTKGLPLTMSQSSGSFPCMTNRLSTTGVSPLRIPSTSNSTQIKLDKVGPSISQISNSRSEMINNKINPPKPTTNTSSSLASPSYQIVSHTSTSPAQPSPRSQTRSPSSSPKLVIAEEKQSSNSSAEQNLNQSNQITSTQLQNIPKIEPPKATAGPSKPVLKPVKSLTSTGKITGIRQPITPTLKSNPANLNSPADYLRPQLISAQHALLRHQMDAWYKAQRQYDFDLFKNMTNMAHQTNQNNFNNKEK